ncbi:MAG: substrate-binding domain-containing protein [Chloroflexi bacterium]|nr:substrate-binding domain-containing protein [Chloroflexota bacterium]
MKRTSHLLVLALFALLLVLGISSVTAQDSEVYIVFVPKLVHPWYEDVRIGIETASQEMAARGVTVRVDWDAPQQADVLEWTQRIEAAIAKQPDILAVSCLDPDAGRPLIEEAVANGITVFGFDTPCTDAPLTTFVGHADATGDGALMAQVLGDALGGEGEVAILIGSPGAVNHQQRVNGFREAMAADYPGITIVAEEADNDDLERAINLTSSILQAHPNVRGIFGANASNPIGAAQAVVEAGRTGEVLVVGMDDLPETVDFIREGAILSVAVQNVQDIGYWSTIYAVGHAQGWTTPVLHETGSFPVTAENVDTYKSN